jgi:hypothetical protein
VDLITANSGDNTLTILTNNGTGLFASNATVKVGNQPEAVVAADLNGDGLLDLIAANTSDSTLTVLLGATQELSVGAAVLLDNNGNSLAGNGSGLTGMVASNLTGTLSLAQLPGAAVTNNERNVSLSGSFTGNGGGLTNLSILSTQVVGGANGNLFIGTNAGNLTMTGIENLGMGQGALSSNTTGVANAAFGYEAMSLNTTGIGNTAIGASAMLSNNIGNDNTAIGVAALADNGSGSQNAALGAAALQNNTIGSDNMAIGYQSLTHNTNGFFNTAAGYQALANNTSGQLNIGVGAQALVFNTAGSNNTAVGGAALAFNVSGIDNTAIGRAALRNLGSSGGAGGSNNIALGDDAGTAFTTNETGNIDIGNLGVAGENNTIRIGDPTVQTNTFIAGVINGNGGGLTNLNASTLSSGTIPLARLPGLSLANVSGGLAPGTSYTVIGNQTGGIGSAVVFIDNNNISSGDAPALRVIANGGANSGALSVSSQNPQLTGLLAQFGNSNAFVVSITNDGTIYCKATVLSSDRNVKENFTVLDGRTVLDKLAALPVTEWNYKDDAADKKHIGPVAQDFHAAFGLNGTDDRHISTMDEGGVALAAIQGLNEKLDEKNAEITALKDRLAALEIVVKSLAEKK